MYRDKKEMKSLETDLQHNIFNKTHRGGGMKAACMDSSRAEPQAFIDDLTGARNSQINSEVLRDTLSAQIQANAAKMITNTTQMQTHS